MNPEMERIYNRIVDDEIFCNQNMLMEELLKNQIVLCEDIENLDFSEEIYEWWAVSDWLAEKLRENNKIVIEKYSQSWWGRTETGISLSSDSDLMEIIEELAEQ